MKQNNECAFRAGFSCVVVKKRLVDERTQKETIEQIHEGIVVQNLGTHVRVFNSAPKDKGGDVSPESSEVFAVESPNIWVEQVGELAEGFPIPPTLR